MSRTLPRCECDRPRTAASAAAALADQATTSAVNFLTGVLVGRLCGADELGVYAMGFYLVVLVLQVQTSLVTAPYTVFAQRLEGADRARYAGSVLVYFASLAAAGVAGFAAGAGVLSCGLGPEGLAPVIWVLAAAVPFHLLREFARQFSFAHFRTGWALALDAAVAAMQLAALAALAVAGLLSAVAAHVALGVACGVAALVWLVGTRRRFAIRPDQLARSLGPHWRFGRWIFAALTAQAANVIVLQWLLLGWMDEPAAAGVFSACMTVVVVTNPLLLGASNVLSPRAARAMASDGPTAVHRVVARGTLWVGLAMGAFCGVMLVWGDPVVSLVYGKGYAGNGPAIAALALAVVPSGLGLAATHGLAAMERSDLIFRARFLGLATVLTAGLLLVQPLGVLGAAYAYLAGSAVDAAAMYVGYRTHRAVAESFGRVSSKLDVEAAP